MISLLSLLAFALPAAAPSAPVAFEPQTDATSGEVPIIQDLGNAWRLQFDESKEAMNLEQFIKICQRNTAINFTFSTDTQAVLKSTKVQMFGPKVIPKDEFYSFFQIIMIINRFVCTRIGPEHLSVVVVASLDSPARSNVRGDALYITAEEVDRYADQPATLVQTVLHLPNMDVRTMGNSMRAMVVDPNTMQLVPIPESNSLILIGFGSNIAALVRMLRLMNDVSEPEPAILPEFEVIPLEYAAADEIADTLEELLEASRRATNTGGTPQAQGATGRLQQGTTETKIMVQPRTNSLLVMAMPDDMPRLKELVARLDVDQIDRERNYHFLSLETADAEELAEVLTNFLQDASRVQGNTPGGAGRQQGQASSSSTEIAVVPDPATNSLLVAAPRSRYDEVLDLIERLDRRQDQVLIETALIELSGRDVLDIGIELGGADIPGGDGTGGFGVSDFGMSTFSDNDGDGIPDVRVPNIARGITAGLIDGGSFSLPVLIAASQERRNTNVLNIPSVLVNNNGSALVTTLDEQPTTTVTINGAGGQSQETFNGYEKAGITLSISPTISAGKYLRLGIELEVSTFQGSFSGAIPPPKITRTIQTTVNVPDGDTMVIGGIIVDNKTDNRTQVPFLGDIPFVGVLFRRTDDTEDRTTLYFFVTPHIMHDREFADLAAFSYKKKLQAADTIGASRVRIIDDRFGADSEVLDFSGFDVPVYQAPDHGAVNGADIGIGSEEANEMLENKNSDN